MTFSMRRVWLSSLLAYLHLACTSSSSPSNGTSVLCTDSLLRALRLEEGHIEAIPVELRAPGEIVSIPEQTVEMRAPVEGTVMEVFVQVGQSVAKGQALLRIRSPQLLEKEARLRTIQAQLPVQRLRLSTIEQMGRDSLASVIEVQNARAELQSLEAEYQQLLEQFQLFRREGAGFVLIAPRSGTVLAVGITAGANVEAGDFLLRVADLSKIRFQVYLYPEQFIQAKVGMFIQAFLPGWEKPVEFRIEKFLPVLNEETRAVTAYADLPNPNREFLPGAFFQAKLHSLRSDSAIAIPIGALILDADQQYALVYHPPCQWEVRRVEVIKQTADKAYVRGVALRETVATHQALFLYQQLTRTL